MLVKSSLIPRTPPEAVESPVAASVPLLRTVTVISKALPSASLLTSAGASAVGDSTTRAVVSGLVLIVIIDGVFAVLYFFLDV